jgi:Uma2 family endonuclease
MAAPAQRRVTYAEYLALEEQAATKHEYCGGVLVAMAGGSREHSLVKTNLTRRIAEALDGTPSRAFDADLRCLVEATGLATYPDLTVVCGTVRWAERDRDAVTNPTAIFEVLSPSTAGYDLGEKFDHFARIPSLQEYVAIDSERVGVRVF